MGCLEHARQVLVVVLCAQELFFDCSLGPPPKAVFKTSDNLQPAELHDTARVVARGAAADRRDFPTTGCAADSQ